MSKNDYHPFPQWMQIILKILNIIGPSALDHLVAYILGMFESEVVIDLDSMYPMNVNTICDNDCKCKQWRARLPCSGINNVRAIVAE